MRRLFWPNRRYVYFVSYSHHTAGGGFGCCEIVSPDPIQNIGQIHEIQETIHAGNGYDQIIVISFQLLRTEDTA